MFCLCASGKFSYVVLLAQLLGEGCAHDVAADGRAGAEVGFARLAPRGGEACTSVSDVSDCRVLLDVPWSTLVILAAMELSRGVLLEVIVAVCTTSKIARACVLAPRFRPERKRLAQPRPSDTASYDKPLGDCLADAVGTQECLGASDSSAFRSRQLHMPECSERDLPVPLSASSRTISHLL
jgi:hypothetical protein